ncbi:MAG TPA: hypothetical protein VEX41_00635 [Candidatus Eisenbacteria bacterium]|nr:hypothetical protein [Candidatus Eisenbacteria bacterium]
MFRVVAVPLLLVAMVLAACSANPAASAVVPSDSPTAEATPTADLADWNAFKERAEAYAGNASAIAELSDGFWVVDLGPDKAPKVAEDLRQESEELLGWLDENPPDACYAASWDSLHAAAKQVAAGAEAFLADPAQFERAYREMSKAGSDLTGTVASIQDSSATSLRCSADGTP